MIVMPVRLVPYILIGGGILGFFVGDGEAEIYIASVICIIIGALWLWIRHSDSGKSKGTAAAAAKPANTAKTVPSPAAKTVNTVSTASAQTAKTADAAAAPAKKTCSACGKVMDEDGLVFCPFCGTKL